MSINQCARSRGTSHQYKQQNYFSSIVIKSIPGKRQLQSISIFIFKVMLSQLILGLLVILAAGATNCAQGDEIECLSSICPNYHYINSTCQLNSTSSCTASGCVFYSNTCVKCSSLGSSNCSQICPDYLYQVASGSGPSSCTSCQTLYGQSCIRCTSSNCLICAYSSNLTLSTDRLSCVNNNCPISNCLICYTGGSRCYKCKAGYTVNANFLCETSQCSITNCITCSTSKCDNCFPGYSLSTDRTACEAVCTDINCVDCIGPEICGTCATAYYPNSNGLCVIDCAQISVSNCMECISYSTCTKCNSGYDLLNGGSLCTPSCTVSNCQKCVSGDTTTCKACKTGYDLSSDGKTCTQAVCYIPYCQTCATISTCQTCISGFTLSADKTTCTTNCTTSFPNCILCTSTACISCNDGYQIAASGQCQLICSSISNCIRCLSSTQCAACADGYQLSSNYKSCSIVCRVRGCLTCTSSTSSTCETCESGYTAVINANGDKVCSRDCRPGQVNTSPSGINCENCETSISFCNTCSYQNSQVVCDSCMAGYFVNGFRCDKCSDALSNCLTCISATTCSRCVRGYRVIQGTCSNNACSASVTNCYSCKSSTPSSCYRCNPGYYVNSAGQCELKSCSDSYVFDEDTKTCVCPTATYEFSGACYPCADSNCYQCTLSVCTSCVRGYYPVGSTCQPCIKNCRSCTSGSNCIECQRRYSLNGAGSCVYFGGGRSCAVSPLGISYRCDSGCRTCIVGASNNQIVICLIPEDGYSIVGGVITRCDPTCQSCESYLPTLCTSCYSRYVLVSGECVACNDTHALTCSPYNTNYSLTCDLGYTATYSSASGSSGGVCFACADYCRKCNRRGPGQCDEGMCNSGSVQLLGTTNCSLCFSGCVRCSNSDPNTCLDCGTRRYKDTSGLCQSCSTGCKTCQTSASNCLSCETGYSLVGTSCVTIPSNCVSLNSSTGQCTGCFASYTLNSATKACDVDLSCNNGSNCLSCPDQYYLHNFTCTQCSLASASNCIACLTTNISQCLRCSDGYYLDSSYACQACSSTCQTCDSSSFCTKAVSGYYITLLSSGEYTGVVEQCTSPCATCIDYSDFCLSCASGYFLYGSNCQRNLYLYILIILSQGASSSIFSNADSADRQLFLSIRSFNRIGNAIYGNAPSKFRDGNNWRKHTKFRKFRYGSVGVEFAQAAGQYTDGTQATSDFTNYLTSGNFDGFSFVSSSITAEGFSTSTGSSTSLGLILGLSIPLSILLILVIVLVVYTYRKDKSDFEEEGHKNGFYSEDVIQKAEDL